MAAGGPISGAAAAAAAAGDGGSRRDDGKAAGTAADGLVVKAGGKGHGSFVRADQLDFAKLDASLERALSRSVTRTGGSGDDQGELERVRSSLAGWEIDPTQINLTSVVAHGTYGTVYRGTFAGQDVAVKLLEWGEENTMSRAQLHSLRAAFEQEVAIWHMLSNPNVTQFIGAALGSKDGFLIPSSTDGDNSLVSMSANVCCVVVEFLPGGTLKDYLIKHQRKKIPFRKVLQLALDVARGLAYLHSKKIVHRDVKSENMLLDKRGTVKIADFGVARVEAKNPRDMTGETGTIGYMAPEILDGKPYNRQADVYSYGICLWEVYCCKMPFPELSFKEMAAVVNQGMRPSIPSCCPKQLAQIMSRCWDASPTKRPEMDEVVRLLEAIDPTKGRKMCTDEFERAVSQPKGCFCF
eukprot:SM000013S26485  [mRNA]  locus=s13:633302:635360:- [translate_table: standard]